jgi:hypothetical protein
MMHNVYHQKKAFEWNAQVLSIPKRLRFALARFRTSSHSLEIEVGRHKNINKEDRLCKYRGLYNNDIIEDENHGLFHCSA